MKEKRTYFLIREENRARYRGLNELPVPEVLDMLRYDVARVESNAPPGFYLLSSAAFAAPHADRWASFGIDIAATFKHESEAYEQARKVAQHDAAYDADQEKARTDSRQSPVPPTPTVPHE